MPTEKAMCEERRIEASFVSLKKNNRMKLANQIVKSKTQRQV